MLASSGSVATFVLLQTLGGGSGLPDPTALGLPASFAMAAATAPVDLERLAAEVLSRGCGSKLLGNAAYRLAESQLACDAFVSFAIVNRRLSAGDDPNDGELATLSRLLDDALAAASRRPYAGQNSVSIAGHALPDSVVYRGLVGLMAAGLVRLGVTDGDLLALFDGLAQSLVDDYAKRALLPSYGAAIWPCDNAIAVAALSLHGRLRANAASAKTAETVAELLASLLDRKRGFPTRVDAQGHLLEATARGSALAWATVFLSMGGVGESARFADTLLVGFCDRMVVGDRQLAACREWPRGVARGPDVTSGPILRGYGVAASALAIAATHGAGREVWHQSLLNTGYAVGLAGITAAPRRYPLENAILAWASSVQPW
jgi:hypothetical protein